MQSIAVLIECKSKPSEAPLQEMRKSREMSGKQEKSKGNQSVIIAVMR